jgi:rubredoxin
MAKVTDEYPIKGQELTDEQLKAKATAEALAAQPEKNQSKEFKQSKFPSEIVELPSKGLLYPEGSALATGKVEMKYMTAKEEDILTSQNLIKNGTVIDTLLRSLIVGNGEGYAINYNDLLVGDKNAIMIAARILGYGSEYPCDITCPSCGAKSRHTVNLAELENKPWTEPTNPHTNEFDFTLPASKRNLTFKLLTHGDEKAIDTDAKRMKKKKLGAQGVSYELTSRLKRMIIAIDGETDRNKINNFVDNEFLSRDSLAFRQNLENINPDVDMTIYFECPECGHEQADMTLPMNVNFFWPRA